MCGIAGVMDLGFGRQPENKPTLNQLKRMALQLHHRGPDGEGFYLNDAIGLAHTRLSIIDLATGHQPLHNSDKTISVVFNGEIFNYLELRAELQAIGYVFTTRSDTEVLVHLYHAYGKDFVSRLNGQFSIGLWDATQQTLLLVRDRVGITPLFYQVINNQLRFASEVKALLSVSDHSLTVNPQALDQLFTFWAPVASQTLFQEVKSLPPGHIMLFGPRGVSEHLYWDWQFPDQGDCEVYHKAGERELTDQLSEHLTCATNIRLRSDVPVGAYLSGGLDSSALVATMSEILNESKQDLKASGNLSSSKAVVSQPCFNTFSIGFDSKEYDESFYQNMLLDDLSQRHQLDAKAGIQHSSLMCKDQDIVAGLEKTLWHTESPILRTAPVPMRLLSQHVGESRTKVILTGEGSDEVLGGYDIFKEAKIRRFWAQQPKSSWRPRLLERLYPYLSISQTRSPHQLQRFLGQGLDQHQSPFFAHLPRWNLTASAKQFFSPALNDQLSGLPSAIEVLTESLPSHLQRWSGFNQAQYIEAKTLMAQYLLCSQGDRMLMANSVEGRFPFLDHRLIEFANKLPERFKMKVLTEKYLLKRAMAKRIPSSIVDRHKQPYRAPDAAAFFSNAFPEKIAYILSSDKLKEYGLFDHKKVSFLLKKAHKRGLTAIKDNQAFIGVLSTQLWYHQFIDQHK